MPKCSEPCVYVTTSLLASGQWHSFWTVPASVSVASLFATVIRGAAAQELAKRRGYPVSSNSCADVKPLASPRYVTSMRNVMNRLQHAAKISERPCCLPFSHKEPLDSFSWHISHLYGLPCWQKTWITPCVMWSRNRKRIDVKLPAST